MRIAQEASRLPNFGRVYGFPFQDQFVAQSPVVILVGADLGDFSPFGVGYPKVESVYLFLLQRHTIKFRPRVLKFDDGGYILLYVLKHLAHIKRAKIWVGINLEAWLSAFKLGLW